MAKTNQHFKMTKETKTMITMTAGKDNRNNFRHAMIDAQVVYDAQKRKKVSATGSRADKE